MDSILKMDGNSSYPNKFHFVEQGRRENVAEHFAISKHEYNFKC